MTGGSGNGRNGSSSGSGSGSALPPQIECPSLFNAKGALTPEGTATVPLLTTAELDENVLSFSVTILTPGTTTHANVSANGTIFSLTLDGGDFSSLLDSMLINISIVASGALLCEFTVDVTVFDCNTNTTIFPPVVSRQSVRLVIAIAISMVSGKISPHAYQLI